MVEQEGRSEESTNPSFALLTSEFLNFLETTDSLNFLSFILVIVSCFLPTCFVSLK